MASYTALEISVQNLEDHLSIAHFLEIVPSNFPVPNFILIRRFLFYRALNCIWGHRERLLDSVKHNGTYFKNSVDCTWALFLLFSSLFKPYARKHTWLFHKTQVEGSQSPSVAYYFLTLLSLDLFQGIPIWGGLQRCLLLCSCQFLYVPLSHILISLRISAWVRDHDLFWGKALTSTENISERKIKTGGLALLLHFIKAMSSVGVSCGRELKIFLLIYISFPTSLSYNIKEAIKFLTHVARKAWDIVAVNGIDLNFIFWMMCLLGFILKFYPKELTILSFFLCFFV